MDERDAIAQEKFGKPFSQLDSMQRIQVGGTEGTHAPARCALLSTQSSQQRPPAGQATRKPFQKKYRA